MQHELRQRPAQAVGWAGRRQLTVMHSNLHLSAKKGTQYKAPAACINKRCGATTTDCSRNICMRPKGVLMSRCGSARLEQTSHCPQGNQQGRIRACMLTDCGPHALIYMNLHLRQPNGLDQDAKLLPCSTARSSSGQSPCKQANTSWSTI
jgi:hypothetical protein